MLGNSCPSVTPLPQRFSKRYHLLLQQIERLRNQAQVMHLVKLDQEKSLTGRDCVRESETEAFLLSCLILQLPMSVISSNCTLEMLQIGVSSGFLSTTCEQLGCRTAEAILLKHDPLFSSDMVIVSEHMRCEPFPTRQKNDNLTRSICRL